MSQAPRKTSRIKCRRCKRYCGGRVTEATPVMRAESPYANVCVDCKDAERTGRLACEGEAWVAQNEARAERLRRERA